MSTIRGRKKLLLRAEKLIPKLELIPASKMIDQKLVN
jgi:hypothetical protein